MRAEPDEKAKEHVRFQTGAAVLIAVMLLCCALYFFAGAGRDAQTETADIEPVPTPAAVTAGAFEEGIQGLSYTRLAPDAYSIDRGELPAVELRLDMEDYLVEALLLTTEMPQTPEKPDKDATVLEQRLYENRKAYYAAQCAWMTDNLPVLIRAMKPTGVLTEADIYDLLYYVQQTMEKGERKEKTIKGFCVRAYEDGATEPSMLCVSLQDNAAITQEK